MWKYYLDEAYIAQAISIRRHSKKSTNAAKKLLISLGYKNEVVRSCEFDDLIFTSGSMDEMYSTEEIKFCEEIGYIFVSTGRDIFDFFIIDVDEDEQYDAFYIGSIIKIINKAFKGRNIIIFQHKDSLLFGSRYISKISGRDYHFTYWMKDVTKIRAFSSYNLCKKSPSYSYTLFMSNVTQLSLFRNKYWNERNEEIVELKGNFITLSKELGYIVSKQIDSFELLDKALQATEFIKTGKKMSDYRDNFDDNRQELIDDEDLLFNYLKV